MGIFSNESNNSEILFYHSNKPSYGKYGDKGGYSITVYTSGQVLRKTYKFGIDAPVSSEIIDLSDNGMEAILDIIIKHNDKIEECPTNMCACCDGNIYEFVFGSKTIIADSSIEKNHFLLMIAKQIIRIVSLDRKNYNINPEHNMPRMVYAPPDVMMRMREDESNE